MATRVSDRAIDCFTHGVAHLISELGTDRGLRKGMDVLEELAGADLSGVLAEATEKSGRRQAPHLRRPSQIPDGDRG